VLIATFLGLPDDAGPYALVIGIGFFLGVYAHAAKMPRLLIFAIAVVLIGTIVATMVSFSYDGSAPRTRR
jgi:hypothetical protein